MKAGATPPDFGDRSKFVSGSARVLGVVSAGVTMVLLLMQSMHCLRTG